ncbi:GNAT family N-acetyltransferase [Flagellimonas sp.]|uniref:GNAT family N-acetyltransferase n=1 Tax=Flagellimonas sp. TaxID=2058762 RepID=UPI003BB1AF1E
MELNTKRLQLIPITAEDTPIFHQTNIDPHIKKYLWDNEEIPAAVSEEIIQEVGNKFEQEKWGLWKIMNTSDQTYMGYIGFWFFFEEALPQLVYALLPKFTGNGYATEAAQEIIRYAFDTLKFDCIKASMDSPNQDSVKVCDRLHMQLVEEKMMEGKSILFYRLDNNKSSKA